MLILTLRTDKPEAEIGLYNDTKQLTYLTWQAHRQLAETIHFKIKDVLDSEDYQLNNVQAIAVYKGPGSFTGLRIGLSVANALAYSLKIPLIGGEGEAWLQSALSKLQVGEDDHLATPEYGALPHITQQKK